MNRAQTSAIKVARRFLQSASARKIIIERGFLIEFVDATATSIPMWADGCEGILVDLEYQLYDENNDPVSGSNANYRGMATIVDRGADSFLVLGDLVRGAGLTEYRIDKSATKESLKRLDATKAGITAALIIGKPGRRLPAKGTDWLNGYDEAMKWRKRNQ